MRLEGMHVAFLRLLSGGSLYYRVLHLHHGMRMLPKAQVWSLVKAQGIVLLLLLVLLACC